MSQSIHIEHHDYASVNACTQIQAVFWMNDDVFNGKRPVAVIQLIHGMGEHIGRYDRFARYLAGLGYLVCGNDHVGHGKTAGTKERFGMLPKKNPVDVMVDDVEQLRKLVAADMQRLYKENPDSSKGGIEEPGKSEDESDLKLDGKTDSAKSGEKTSDEDTFKGEGEIPYFMFGHSMGSLILRCYLPKYGAQLDGAIICGTTMPSKFLSCTGVLASKALIALRGPDAKSPFLHKMAYGVYSKKIPNARTPFDWISSDPDEVDAFINDEGTGFMFTGTVYLALTDAAFDAAKRHAFTAVPKTLPLLLIAGDEDPVGDFGRMVEDCGNRYRKAGVESVTIKLYGGMRHEILNEVGREEVFSDVVSWINEVIVERKAKIDKERLDDVQIIAEDEHERTSMDEEQKAKSKGQRAIRCRTSDEQVMTKWRTSDGQVPDKRWTSDG